MKLKIAIVLLAAATLLVGCSKKPEPFAARAAKARGDRPTCDTLVPASVREKHMAGTAMSAEAMVDRVLTCSATRDGALAYRAVFDCRSTAALRSFEAFKRKASGAADGGEIPGLGRDALGNDTALAFFDDDTDCFVLVASYGEQKGAVAIAKELSAILAPSLLPEPYGLDCKKLLPQPLRERLVDDPTSVSEPSQADHVMCQLKLSQSEAATIWYRCGDSFEPASIERTKAENDKHLVPSEKIALGTAGLYFSELGTHSVTFIDAEASCSVFLKMPGGTKDQAIELAKTLEQALTAESAK